MLMQKCPGSREAAPPSRRARRPGRAPGTDVNLESGDESEPPLEEPARLCREAAGSTAQREATSVRPSPSRPFPSPHQPDLGSWALIVLMKFWTVVVVVLNVILAASYVSSLLSGSLGGFSERSQCIHFLRPSPSFGGKIWGPAVALEREGLRLRLSEGLRGGRGSSRAAAAAVPGWTP